MERPNRKQWVVLWCGVAWTLGSLVVAEDYLVRALLAGFVVTAVLFLQLGNRRDASQQVPSAAPPVFPPISEPNLEIRQPSPDDASPRVESQAVVAPAAQGRPGPSGVGGWLVLVLLGPLLTPFLAVWVVSQYSEFWTDPWFFTLAIAGGILAGWSFYVALALLNRWPTAPKLAQAQLIVSWVFWIGLGVLAAMTTGVDLSKSIPAYIGSLLGTALWVSYLKQSHRVKATYGPLPPGPVGPVRARMLGLAAGILVSLLAVGIADSRREAWAEFHPDDGLYEVQAPGEARQSTLKNGAVQVAFGNDVRGFVVSKAVLAPDNADARSYLEGVRNSVITNLKASMIKSTSVSLDGYPGIEFVATFPGTGITGDLRGRVYRSKSEGFLLLVTGPQGGRTASEADRFFRSFQITR